DVSRYGIVDAEELSPGLYRVNDLREKPSPAEAPSRLAIVGRYVLDPEVFDLLEKQAPGYGGEIQLTDALRALARRKPVYAYRPRARRYDVGDKLGFLTATIEFALARPDLGPPLQEFLRTLTPGQPPV
ncbi:MAG TPA: UTP--glucose-1-phosphate uridylyltransferase, partial [Firmicutes bacterium]|nr:UTP--glucose-1-phosphate uridylyltransferase [Bacillota bacterium]